MSDLPSGAALSYSEVSTFEQCRRQHFYRYFLRLKAKSYMDNRHMTIGGMTHDPIELLYRATIKAGKSAVTRKQSDRFAATVADAYRSQSSSESMRPYFREDVFAVDSAMASEMFWVFVQHCYADEPYEIVEPEAGFEIEMGGRLFVGFADQLYRVLEGCTTLGDGRLKIEPVPAGIYVGEVKTRGNNFKSRVRTKALKDLQTRIYIAAFKKLGHDVQGTIRTILKKPPKDIFEFDPGRPVAEQIEAVRAFYAEADPSTLFRREIVPIDIDVSEVEAELEGYVGDMVSFYQDPYRGFVEVERKYRHGFPCGWCEYVGLCHDGVSLADDHSFTYKKRRPNRSEEDRSKEVAARLSSPTS